MRMANAMDEEDGDVQGLLEGEGEESGASVFCLSFDFFSGVGAGKF